MLELKQSSMNTTKIMIVTIVLSTIMVLSILANNDVFAKEIYIENLYLEPLVFKEVQHNPNVKMNEKKYPPGEVKGYGGYEKFEVDLVDTGSDEPVLLKLQYYVGKKGSEQIVEFGFKGQEGPNDLNNLNCFTNTPDNYNIKGSYSQCNGKNTKYTFTENNK